MICRGPPFAAGPFPFETLEKSVGATSHFAVLIFGPFLPGFIDHLNGVGNSSDLVITWCAFSHLNVDLNSHVATVHPGMSRRQTGYLH